MWQEIEGLKKRVDNQRPLNSDKMKMVAQKLHEDWTYNTNAIEGNTFTYQETAFFLREGLTVKGKTLREHLEIINHIEAIRYLEGILETEDLGERLIKDFHALLFMGVREVDFPIGNYKIRGNHVLTVSGTVHQYCPAIHVAQEMENLLAWYNAEKGNLHPVEMAARFHHKFIAIHPFADGNGRVGRLCMNFILMKNGYVPAVIRNEHRLEYYQALEQADQQNLSGLIELVAEEVKRSLQLIVEHL